MLILQRRWRSKITRAKLVKIALHFWFDSLGSRPSFFLPSSSLLFSSPLFPFLQHFFARGFAPIKNTPSHSYQKPAWEVPPLAKVVRRFSGSKIDPLPPILKIACNFEKEVTSLEICSGKWLLLRWVFEAIDIAGSQRKFRFSVWCTSYISFTIKQSTYQLCLCPTDC